MPKYKVLMIYPDGNEILEPDLFDSEEEAEEHGCYLVGCYRSGSETLNMSNPGDYPYDEDDFDDANYEVIEVDD